MGARFDIGLEALGDWRGLLHLSWDRPLEIGSDQVVGIPVPVIFSGPEPALG
jgi:hypothetical protein